MDEQNNVGITSPKKPGLRIRLGTKQKKKEEQQQALPQRRSIKNFSRKEWLIILLPAIAAIVAVVIAVILTSKVPVVTLDEEGYQVYGEANVVIPEGSQLLVRDENTILKSGANEQVMTLPIYLADRDAVILTVNMIYYQPRTGQYNLVPQLSEMSVNEAGQIFQTREGKTVQAGKGFLYDGANFYLFLEPVTVKLTNYDVDLPALSYVEAVSSSNIMLYNHETGKVRIVESDGRGTAIAGLDDYEISLFGDTVTTHDGEKILLASRPEVFETLK